MKCLISIFFKISNDYNVDGSTIWCLVSIILKENFSSKKLINGPDSGNEKLILKSLAKITWSNTII